MREFMQRMSTGALTVAVSFIILIVAALILLKIEYEVPKPKEWAESIKKYKQPITENIRVVDSETGGTILWYSDSSAIRPTKIEKSDSGQWIVTVEKIK